MSGLLRVLRQMRSSDPCQRLEVLRLVGRWVLPEYRFKWPQMDWWRDGRFNDFLTRFGELDGMNTDRRWMVTQLLRLVEAVPGDTAECGVYQGAGSFLICQANVANPHQRREHHIFDSFEGLSAPSSVDGAHWVQGALSCGQEVVGRNLSRFEGVHLYKGWIPERFPEVAERRFSFVHIDVDLYQPTLDSAAFFYPRMSPGGIILCDDYGFDSCPGATRAMDGFLADKPEKMVSLSAGGGFLIKGVQTAPDHGLR